jgi:hypothetical protein
VHKASHGFAAEIHERARLGEQQLLTRYLADAYSGLALPSPKPNGMNFGEVMQATESNIVPIMSISLTRVPQPDNDLHTVHTLQGTV